MKKITLLFIVALLNFIYLCSAVSAADAAFFFYKQHDGASEKPNFYTDTFNAVPGQALLRVENGGGEDLSTRNSSAENWLNWGQIFGFSDCNKNITDHEATGNLTATNMKLESGTVPPPAATVSAAPATVVSGASVVLPWKGGFLVIKLKSDAVPQPTVTISADPISITAGGSSTLNWTSTNTDSVSIAPDIGTISANGTQSVSPSETTTYTITAVGAGGTVSESVTVTVLQPPTVSLSADPVSITAGGSSTLNWTSTDANTVSIDNGIGDVALNGSVSVEPTVTTTYTITAVGAGGTVSESVTVTVVQPPSVSLSADPVSITAGGNSTLTWTSTNADSVSITPDIGTVSASGTRSVSPSVTTTYTITATGSGGTATDTATVEVSVPALMVLISAEPEIIALGTSTLLSWQSNGVDNVHIDNEIEAFATDGSLSVTPNHTTTYTITGSGEKGTVSSQVTVQVNSIPEPLPEGSFGTQYNDLVPPDATVTEYDAKRFSLITGTVNDMSGSPLADVRITVHGHPEYGTVLTDTDGKFTIPVDGGGTISIAYKHAGFITSHRQIYVPWNDIAIAETVQMLVEDPVATKITFDGNPETVVAHASTQITDEFGSRSATMVFQGDNMAYLVDEQGNDIQPLSTVTTRATEFETPEAMPAVLPPNSAYTYCAELSVDGAKRVRFAKPVIVWVDNFLGFDVGEAVPVGYYDRDRGVWVPSDNGVVVKLLDTDSDGVVDALDADGDGQPDDLNNDGSFADEVTGLEDSSRYAPGATFWRTAVTHFTPWDCNWPYGPPADATAPNPDGTPDAEVPINDTNNGMCKANTDVINSYVKKRGRIFHEDIPIPGTDMTLHYASNRVDGYQQVITVPASGDTVPESLKSIIVEVELAGRTLTQTLEALPNQQAQFTWDGLDYLGREAGTVDADVAVGFVYDAVYMRGGNFSKAFAQAGTEVTRIRARQEVTSWRRFQLQITAERDAGNGSIAEGWTLSDHHTLGTGATHLYKGDGSILQNKNSNIITTVAGNGSGGFSGDNGSATEASLDHPERVAVDQAGNIFIADAGNHRIRKVNADGIITTIVGNGSNGYNGDNISATEASLDSPLGVAIDQAGNIFIADTGNNRIRKVNADGIITTIVGNGSNGYNGDNISATEASLDSPLGVAIDQAGNIFIADTGNNRIRKVDTNGVITTVAGNDASGYSGDNIPATEAALYLPGGVAVDQAGNIFIIDSMFHRIRKVDAAGIITTVAGNGFDAAYNGDNIPATEAGIESPSGVAIDQAGNIFIADTGNNRIRMVDVNGIINTVTGNGSDGYSGDNGPATKASLNHPGGVAISQEGNIFIADILNSRIRKVANASSVFNSHIASVGDIPFADSNGLGYIMSTTGLHKKTIALDTGLLLRDFSYDADDNLISITDQFGNVITIERLADGTPTTIISPDGLRTELNINGDKQLTKIIYPDSSAYNFTYTPDSLMTVETEPNGNRFEHVFDANGKLLEVIDEEGGNWQYTRQRLANGDVRIDSLTAEGNRTTNLDNTSSTGAFTTTTIDPSGNESLFSRSGDGLSEETTLSCGMSSTAEYGLDAEYKYKVVKNTSTQSPAGLTKATQLDKTYQDTDADKIPDLITKTVSSNGRTTTLVHNTLSGEKTVTSPEGRIMTSQYDPATLLTTSVHVPGLLPTSYTYDAKGRTTAVTTDTRTAGFSYTAEGFLASLTDPEGRTTSYSHDSVGRVTGVTRPDSSTVQFSYDSNGNMTVLTNPSATDHVFGYNKVNKKNAYQTPISGAYSYLYDKDRRLLQANFPSGFQINNIYTDNLLTQTQTPEGNIDYTYLCSSKVGSISKGTESISYDYDGSLLTSETKSGTLNQTLAFAYNNDFNLSAITYAGAAENFSYDNDGLLIGSGAYTLIRNAANGLPEQVSGNALNRSRSFNGYGELTGEDYVVNTKPVTGLSLTRNNNGKILTKTETVNGSAVEYAYTYDDMGRLLTVTKDGTLVEEYQYGLNGSRTYEMNSLKGEAGRSYTYSVEDHLLAAGGVSYQFDANGFLVSTTKGAEVTGYTYSSRGELLEVSQSGGDSIEYLHDPMGRRIAKKVNGTVVEKYLWLGLTQLLAVYDGSDSLLQRFEYADGRMPVAMTAGGATYYLAYDQVGSLRTVSDAAGSVVKEISYDSFGTILSDSNPAFAVPFGFAGGLHDRDTGLVKFGFRDYDPAIGRWVAKDPIFFAGGDVNLYGYVLNDPVNLVDPWGLFDKGGAGKNFQGLNYPGHSDFFGSSYFDYNLEDDDWKTSPFNPLGLERHFRNLPQSEKEAESALGSCNKEKFERAMHRGQDFFSHYNKGYRWYTVGHAFAGKVPDRDIQAWRNAEEWTTPWVHRWLINCALDGMSPQLLLD